MLKINAENPFIKAYIQEMGMEKIEQLVIDFLKTKAQFHRASDNNFEYSPPYKTYGISEETYNKILALKPKKSKEAKEAHHFREDISTRLEKLYGGKSVNEIRDNLKLVGTI